MKLSTAFRFGFGDGQWRIAAALVLLCVSVWLPSIILPRSTFDYIVTFDITQSMNVDDVTLEGAPARRIALARAAVGDALHSLPCGSKLGFSIFSGYRSFMLLMPIEVCSNYDVLLSALDKINDRMRWANASNISKGVYWAIHNVAGLKDTRVVFITDGQEAPPVAVDRAAPSANATGEVHGWLIGVGGDQPAPIPKTDSDGAVTGYWASDEVTQISNAPEGTSYEHLSELREKYLLALAEKNRLNYRRLEEPASLTSALLDGHMAHRTPALTDVRWVTALMALTLLLWYYRPDKWPVHETQRK